MYCCSCLYNLSHTMKPRCPECGRSFNPRNHDATTLRTDDRLKWLSFHLKAYIAGWAIASRRENKRMFCRECHADLRNVNDGHCPTCSTWFDPRDSSTFHRSDSAIKRVWERFRHVCVWRGIVIPYVPLSFGMYAIVNQHTLLPGAGRYGWSFSTNLLPLDGWPAISMGIAWLGLAFALHVHYFWGRVDPVWRISLLGVIVGIVAVVVGWGAALFWAVEHVWR